MPVITFPSHVVLGWRFSLSRGIEVVPIRAICSGVAAFSLLFLLYRSVAEPLCECSECDSEDKRKGKKEKEAVDWRDSVLGEGLKKSDAESTPCCWSGWESPCFAGLGCYQLPSSGMAIVNGKWGCSWFYQRVFRNLLAIPSYSLACCQLWGIRESES